MPEPNDEINQIKDQMLSPTKPAMKGLQGVVDKLVDKIDVLNKEASELSEVLEKAVKSTSGLEDKLKDLTDVMKKRLGEAGKLASGSGKKTKALTTESLKSVLKEALTPSKELLEIRDKVVSKHTIYVRDDRMFQATRVLINSINELKTQFGTARTRVVKGGGSTTTASNDALIQATIANGRIEESAAKAVDAIKKMGQSAAEIDFHAFLSHTNQSGRTLGQTRGEWSEIKEALEKSHHIKDATGKLDKKNVKQLALMTINSGRYSESQRKIIAKELELIRLKKVEGRSQAEIDTSIERFLHLLNSVNRAVDLEKNLTSRLRDEWFGTLRTVDEYKQAVEDSAVQVSRNIKAKIAGGISAGIAAFNDASGFNSLFSNMFGTMQEDKDLAIVMHAQGQIAESMIQRVEAEKQSVETGVEDVKYKKALQKILQKGFKDQKSAINITKEGVRLGHMIGADAEQTAEYLSDWSMSMRMSVEQSRQFSRQLQTVGNITGVVGQDLLEAAKSSESITKNLRNIGRLTPENAAGMAKFAASAKKLGIGPEAIDFMNKLSSPTALSNDQNALSLAALAAQRGGLDISKVLSGGVQTDEERRMFGMGMKAVLEQQLQARLSQEQIDRGVNFSNFKNEANADDIARALDLSMQNAFKVSAGEVDLTAQAFIDSSKTTQDRLAEINTKLATEKLSTKEREILNNQKQELTYNELSAHGTGITNAVKARGMAGIDEYINNVEKRSDLVNDLLLRNIDARHMSNDELTKTLLNQLGINPSDALKNETALLDAFEKAKEEQDKKGIEALSADNPFIRTEQATKELNETMRKEIAPYLRTIAEWLGPYGTMLVGGLSAVGGGAGTGIIGGIIGNVLGGTLKVIASGVGSLLGFAKTSLVGGAGGLFKMGGGLLRMMMPILTSAIAVKSMAVAAAAAVGYGTGWLIRQIPGVENGLNSAGAWAYNLFDSRDEELAKHNKEAIARVRAEEASPVYKAAQTKHQDTISAYAALDQAIKSGDKQGARTIMDSILSNVASTKGGGASQDEYDYDHARFMASKVSAFAGDSEVSNSLLAQMTNKEKLESIRHDLVREMQVGRHFNTEEQANAFNAEVDAELSRRAASMNMNLDGTYIDPSLVADTRLPANTEATIEEKLRQERAAASADSAGSAVAEGIGNVEENTKSTVEELQKLREEMKQLIALLKQPMPLEQDSVTQVSDPTAKRKPKSSTNYYKWHIARYSSNPSMGVHDNVV